MLTKTNKPENTASANVKALLENFDDARLKSKGFYSNPGEYVVTIERVSERISDKTKQTFTTVDFSVQSTTPGSSLFRGEAVTTWLNFQKNPTYGVPYGLVEFKAMCRAALHRDATVEELADVVQGRSNLLDGKKLVVLVKETGKPAKKPGQIDTKTSYLPFTTGEEQ